MKKLITLLFVLVSVIGLSQTPYKDSIRNLNNEWYDLNKEKVELEFVRLIDSARQANLRDVRYVKTFTLKTNSILELDTSASTHYVGIFDTKKELLYILKEEKKKTNYVSSNVYKHKTDYTISITYSRRPRNIKYDSLLTLAAEHHSKYQIEVEPAKEYSHSEYKNYYGYEYKGDMTILENPKDRVEYYCPNIIYLGECVMFDPTHKNGCMGDLYKKSVKDFAYDYFIGFKKSKGHWAAYMQEGDIPSMGAYLGMSKETNYIIFVTVMGKDKNYKEEFYSFIDY